MSDFPDLTLIELRRLEVQIAQEIAGRRLRARLLRSMRELASAEGVTLEAVLASADPATLARRGRRGGRSGPRGPAPVRYMHPSNRALCWSGRGRTPAWIKAWLSTGGSMTALENAAARCAPVPRRG
ncbi:MAG: H-NS histone family protein [Rhodocyclaceae bacterium]|nr:H-NS histone family protein [Rhodocyclaceae bacterium]